MGGFCTLQGSWNRMFVTLVERLVGDGYKKCAIAGRIGMSPQRLSNILNGNGTISEKVLEKLVSAFNLGRVELVLRESGQDDGGLSEEEIRTYEQLKELDDLFDLW